VKNRMIALAIVAALAVLGAAWFLSTHDRVPAKEWVGPSGEARTRQFLAAERLAERMGWEVAEVRALPALDLMPANGVLLVPNRRQALHAGRIADIVRWVESGGHLIAEAEVPGVEDPLLDQLGVVRSRVDPSGKPFVVELPPRGRKLSVSMGDPYGVDTAARGVRLRVGAKIVSFAYGNGTVTAASSLRFARNPSLDDHYARLGDRPAPSIGGEDHAALFLALLSLAPSRHLQVYFRPERLSLTGFLAQNAAPALAAGALLLALWVWSIAPRFGPVAPDAPPGRRRLLDHLRASGRYYWAKGLRSRLVVAARDAALRRLARTQPDFGVAGQAERVARLSTLAGISKEEAARFVAAAGAMRGADFIRLTQHAQRVHSALEKGGNKK
jgi:hypothetical protein